MSKIELDVLMQKNKHDTVLREKKVVARPMNSMVKEVGICIHMNVCKHIGEKIETSLGAQVVKNLPAMQETWVQSLGSEDALERGGNDYPLQYSCLENSRDSGLWQATVLKCQNFGHF